MVQPAFRKPSSAIAFSVLLLVLLTLPVLLSLGGLPSREQAFASTPNRAGEVGFETATIYQDRTDADVVLVGSSMLREDLDPEALESALSNHLARPAHVAVLAMSWPGEDDQYFMLRDYLVHHHPKLIVWDLPHYKSYTNEPHPQSFRWIRYGEYNDALAGLPPMFRFYLYGEMVVGAPRVLLSEIRPNLLGDDEKHPGSVVGLSARKIGFMGAQYIPDSLPDPVPGLHLVPDSSPLLSVKGPDPGAYQVHFMRKFLELAGSKGIPVVYIYLPATFDYGSPDVPQLAAWNRVLGPDRQIVAVPSRILFQGIDRGRFLHFYKDELHLNENGRNLFTRTLSPSVVKAYDEYAPALNARASSF